MDNFIMYLKQLKLIKLKGIDQFRQLTFTIINYNAKLKKTNNIFICQRHMFTAIEFSKKVEKI